MSAVTRFEDLVAWQKARQLTKTIYLTTRSGDFVRDFGLSGQIQRASVSIMSNIAEGFERGRTNEYFHFLCIAKASCAEVRCQLYVAFDVGYVSETEFKQLLLATEEVGRILSGLCASIEKRKV